MIIFEDISEEEKEKSNHIYYTEESNDNDDDQMQQDIVHLIMAKDKTEAGIIIMKVQLIILKIKL